MIIYIDIDNTICSTDLCDYYNSKPIFENIKKANKLFDDGHEIIYWTGRGTGTKRDWTDVTLRQLKMWGVKYHKLLFNKPVYDLFIDDKNMNTKDWK